MRRVVAFLFLSVACQFPADKPNVTAEPSPALRVSEQLIQGTLGESVVASQVVATDGKDGKVVSAPVAADRTFALRLLTGRTYLVTFLNQSELVGVLYFEKQSGSGQFTTQLRLPEVLIAATNNQLTQGLGEPIDLGRVDPSGEKTLRPEHNPADAVDWDGDGTSDFQDLDDDGDSVFDAEDHDEDGDGTPDILVFDTDGDGLPDIIDDEPENPCDELPEPEGCFCQNHPAAAQCAGTDTTAPETTIESQPEALTNTDSATFTFSCNESPCSFECALDNDPDAACTSPTTYDTLADGPHEFWVRAKDAAGNSDLSPESFAWTVDATAPDTTIGTKPSNPTNSRIATFAFTCDESPCSFECKLDSPTYSLCQSPRTFGELADGSHTFTVRAKDAAGNTDPSPESYSWILDTTPVDTIAPDTTIDGQPSNPANTNTATFTFTCNESPCSFECALDGVAYSACTSPTTYNSLADGSHAFSVRAKDAAGNSDLSPESYSWEIDTQPSNPLPGPPSDVAASDGAFVTHVLVTWTASAGAQSYLIYRDGTQVGEALGTVFEDLGAQASPLLPPAPTGVSASDGAHADFVRVAWSPAAPAAGATHTYSLVAIDGANESTPSATDTGFRGALSVAGYEVSRAGADPPVQVTLVSG